MADTNAGQKANPRTQAETKQRRRRSGSGVSNSALAVAPDFKAKLKADGLEGRWINDVGNRMHQKTELDDWDKVPGVEPVPVGMDNRTNQPIMAHYCAKPKAFLEADNRDRMERINAAERAVFSGQSDVEVEGAYNPTDLNSIKRDGLSQG